MLKLALTFRWLMGLLLALAVATAFMLLSQWQLGSATSGQIHEDPAKEKVVPLARELAPAKPVTEDQADAKVSTTGHYVAGDSVLVAGRVNHGEKGYWVVDRFVPEGVKKGPDGQAYSIGVARGFTTNPDPKAAPKAPSGTVRIAGRLLPNEAPVATKDVDRPDHVGSAAAAELTNRWNAPMLAGFVAVEAEVPAARQLPLDSQEHVEHDASLMDPHDGIEKISTRQVVDESVNWLNIFYAAEWVVFAGFAIYLWWRMLADSHKRLQHPENYYELQTVGEAEYYYDESTGRFFYYDAAAEDYFYYDEPEGPRTGTGRTESDHNDPQR